MCAHTCYGKRVKGSAETLKSWFGSNAVCLGLGLGLPVMEQLREEAADDVPTQRMRAKRCACSSLLDSECHYFCHLDIIWVNTPR